MRPLVRLCAAACLLFHGAAKLDSEYDSSSVVVEGEYSTATSIEQLVAKEVVSLISDCCLKEAESAHTSLTECSAKTTSSVNHLVPGVSYLLNEWMAPGHLPYDHQLLEVLYRTKLNAIFIRVPPCGREDLCNNWKSFFQDYYKLLLLATNSTDTSVFLRQRPEEPVWTEWRISLKPPNDYYATGGTVTVPLKNERLCFDRVFRRYPTMNDKFYNGLSLEAITHFQRAVKRYALTAAATTNIALSHSNFFYPYTAIKAKSNHRMHVITFAYRGPRASRRMSNPKLLLDTLGATVSNARIYFLDTSHQDLTSHHQMSIAHNTDILIATHGAFVSNVIYMRRKSLFIELRGDYKNDDNNLNFDVLAKLYGVLIHPVTVHGLTMHTQEQYPIGNSEVSAVVSIVEKQLQRLSAKQSVSSHHY